MAWQRFESAHWLVGVMGVALVACGKEPSPDSSARVYINELMTSRNLDANNGYGKYPDWIELYNAGDEDVDLEGYYIGDSKGHRLEERITGKLFGQRVGSIRVRAKQFKILWADKFTLDPYESDGGQEHYVVPGHLDFKLSAEGEAVWLSDPTGYVLSFTEFGPFPLADAGNAQASWARFPDGTGEFEWCTKPTPGKPNGSACRPRTASCAGG